jgi:two-component system sensor histidine kinase RpfC
MGGAIGVESTPGVGSLFWIELPLAPCAPSDTEEARSSAPTSTRDYNLVAVATRGARVLVAEDYPTNQRVTKLILESRGHLATIVSNGEDALDALETDEFDIALVDLSMPKLSGLDVIRAYRFIAPNPIPVLILSANVTTELIDASLAAGAAEFVSKPVRASTLLDAIDRQVATFDAGNGKLFGAAEVQSNGSPRLKVVSSSILDDSVLEEILRMTSDPTFLGRLLRGFRDDCERLVPQLANDLEKGQIESARDVAHALKGGAGGVGAFALMHAATKLEKLSNVECVEQAAALWAELDDCTRKTIAAISRKVGDESLHPAAQTSKRSISTSAAITATTASTAQHH